MVEIRIHGRGGQGGVTLAKLLATSRFLKGQSVQAFGLYAAERSGAPVQAYCRFDDEEITNRNLIYEPDHVVVLDPTLVGPAILGGLKAGGWILLNTIATPESLSAEFPENRVATVDATAIARGHGLGTRSVPIVNTALAGAVAKLLDLPLEEILAALDHLGFGGGNVDAARDAYRLVAEHGPQREAGSRDGDARPGAIGRGPSFLAGAGGDLPGIKTGQWANEQPKRQQYVPPCNHVCPAGNDVQGFLHALAEHRVDDALEILLRTSPFPATCGRVCPAPCMASCNRIQLDGAVNVRELERYAGDKGEVKLVPAERREERVAVVGSGPAGLAAAYHLALYGYGVTLYEAGSELGGLLRTGIPEFRLPAAVLDRELDRVLDLGVEAVTGVFINRERLLELARNHDAVLVATGLQELRALRLGVGEVEMVSQGIDFLDQVRSGVPIRVDGEDVVVVGGGNTAMDAARTALRLGAASVRVVYRRTRKEMPAIAEEIEEALEEGVEMSSLFPAIGSFWLSGSRPTCRCSPRGRRSGRERSCWVCWRLPYMRSETWPPMTEPWPPLWAAAGGWPCTYTRPSPVRSWYPASRPGCARTWTCGMTRSSGTRRYGCTSSNVGPWRAVRSSVWSDATRRSTRFTPACPARGKPSAACPAECATSATSV
jgi:2-oxoacid:acceptor oxidoreductase gamma subunit (pyruvate/2-ketoisovalerate family)